MTARKRKSETPAPVLALAGDTSQLDDEKLEHPQATPADLAEIVDHWPTLSADARAAILATVRALAGIAAPADDVPAMTRPAALIYDYLEARPRQAIPQGELLDMLSRDHGIKLSPSTFYSRIVPQLKAAGVVNLTKRGWSLPASRRRHCAMCA